MWKPPPIACLDFRQPSKATTPFQNVRSLLEPRDDVACPRAALDEREDEQHAHRQVLQRVGEPRRDAVDGGARRGARPGEASQDERKGYEQNQDDQPRQAHRREVLQVSDSYLAGVV